jgi:hypothetical protein
METVTIHGGSADGEPVSVSLEAEVLSNGSMRLSEPAPFDGSFSHQGVEYDVRARADTAHPRPER